MKEVISKLKPTGSRVILKQERIKQSGSIILMADSAEKSQFCEVIAVGPDVNDIQKGDKVVADKFSGHTLYEDSEVLYVLMDESDVLAIVNE